MTIEVSHLVVNGCSFSYCQGLENPSKQGWPTLLAKKLNVPIVNISCKGSGNDSIMRRTIEYFYEDTNTKPFYIVTLSQSVRREEYVIDYQGQVIEDFVQLASFSDEPIEKAIYEHYNFNGIIAQEKRKLLYWVSIINLFKTNNINYMISDFMPETDHKVIEKVKIENSNLYDFLHSDNFLVSNLNNLTNNFTKLPCGHDGYEAQEFIAELFFSNIIEKYGQINPIKLNYLKTKDFLPKHAKSSFLRDGAGWCVA